MSEITPEIQALLERVAGALERLAPPAAHTTDLAVADAFIWHADGDVLERVEHELGPHGGSHLYQLGAN